MKEYAQKVNSSTEWKNIFRQRNCNRHLFKQFHRTLKNIRLNEIKRKKTSISSSTQMGGWGWEGVRRGCIHTPLAINYFKIMQFCTRNWVYIPNFGLKIRIFLRFAPPFVKFLKFASPFSKSLHTGLQSVDSIFKNDHISLSIYSFLSHTSWTKFFSLLWNTTYV